MSSDGYAAVEVNMASELPDLLASPQDKLQQKNEYFQELADKQSNIDGEIQGLSDQIGKLPNFPDNLDYWVSGFESDFKIKDHQTLSKIKRQYLKLLEERENNQAKLKMFVIDNLLDQIRDVLVAPEKKEEQDQS